VTYLKYVAPLGIILDNPGAQLVNTTEQGYLFIAGLCNDCLNNLRLQSIERWNV